MKRRLTFIGTATVLLELGPFTVLTDPNFLHRGQFAYLGRGMFSRRLTEPSCSIRELPALDAVVLSHLHGDHWDRTVDAELDRDVPVLTTPAAARRLRRKGFPSAAGLPTWTAHTLQRGVARLTVTALPGRHARGPLQLALPPVMGSLVELAEPGEGTLRVYVSGDTVLVDDLREIPRRTAAPDVAVLHLGGTTLPPGLPLGFPLAATVSMDARQGADLLELVPAPLVVPVHHSDYRVFRSPLDAFPAEVARRGLSTTVRCVRPGETVELR